jgi:alkylhydroperoxidase family enzyme
MDIHHAVGVRQGIDDATLAELPDWRQSDRFGARERAALGLADALVRDSEVSDECFAAVREHFSEPETVELVFVIGYQTFASTFAKAFALPPQGFAAVGGGREPARKDGGVTTG